ncbi:MAG: hypothetical protein E7Z64_04325 [Thermoplasmata archaeon]|nr:hypothetical protein [Thermoplasmata archaeon]
MKSTAFAAAVLMLAVGCAAFIGFPSDADPVQVNDETVNVYFDGSGTWVGGEYEVFNVFEAIQAACGSSNLSLYISIANGNDDWTQTTTANGTYPNPDYGTIATVGLVEYDDIEEEDVIVEETSLFSIYGRNANDSTWTDITPYALGWIRPFTDYKLLSELVYDDTIIPWASAFANIAIKMKTTTSLDNVVSQSSLSLKALTDPDTRTDCSYTFIIKDTTGTLASKIPTGATFYARQSPGATATQLTLTQAALSAGIIVYGTGSDAYLALHDATNGAVVAQEETYIYNSVGDYYTNYSWMTHMFGVGTVATEKPDGQGYIYDYWATYKGNTASYSNYTAFNLGYHTNIPGSYEHYFPNWGSGYEPYYCNGDTFVIQYEES